MVSRDFFSIPKLGSSEVSDLEYTENHRVANSLHPIKNFKGGESISTYSPLWSIEGWDFAMLCLKWLIGSYHNPIH